MKKWLIAGMLLGLAGVSQADPWTWEVPYLGTLHIPNAAQDIDTVGGIDLVRQKAIAGFSSDVLGLHKDKDGDETLSGFLGVVAAASTGKTYTGVTNGLVQPYMGLDYNFTKHLSPVWRFVTDAKVQIAGRWDTDDGKPGAVLAMAWHF